MGIFIILFSVFVFSWFLMFLLFKESNENSAKSDRTLKEMQREQLKFERELYKLRSKKR